MDMLLSVISAIGLILAVLLLWPLLFLFLSIVGGIIF